ncbi:MAG: glycosyltransferase family 2 protein [Xanthomonadales bacterium]|nr:glycosyltransferase family 2 protein [Xanthomonadales bacterium]
MMIAVLIVAHDNAGATAQCLRSLAPELGDDGSVWLLDNGSAAAQGQDLREAARMPELAGRCHLRVSAENLGFAGGVNLLLAEVMAGPEIGQVLLLNNDTEPQPGFLQRLRACLAQTPGAGMAAARMMAMDGGQVDSLGICLYRSGLASNRKHVDERLLGPTGGCMLLSRKLLEDMHASHGYWFEQRFFCYAEDTDLVMRARWLGHASAYADDAVVLHHGSLSSGGADNEFVLYHGIRNSIWALARNAPALWLLVHLPWLLLAHGGVIVRNLRKGRAGTVWRLYRDAIAGLPAMWQQRRLIRRRRRLPARAWWSWVEPRLYERDYLRRAWRELFGRNG